MSPKSTVSWRPSVQTRDPVADIVHSDWSTRLTTVCSPNTVVSPCRCPSWWLTTFNIYVVNCSLLDWGKKEKHQTKTKQTKQKNHGHFSITRSLGRDLGLNVLFPRAATRMLRESGTWEERNDKRCCHLTSGEPGSHLGLEKDTNECLLLPGFWKMTFIFRGDYSKWHLEGRAYNDGSKRHGLMEECWICVCHESGGEQSSQERGELID